MAENGERERLKNRGSPKPHTIVLAVFLMAVFVLIIAFPRKRPLRDILPPITRFHEMFGRSASFLASSLEDNNLSESALYNGFCSDPLEAGKRLERILDNALDSNSYCSAMMRTYAQEFGAVRKGKESMSWNHDPGIAFTALCSPMPVSYGGKSASEIQKQSAQNWSAMSPEFRSWLSRLFARSCPAAARFRKIRRDADIDVNALRSLFEQAGNTENQAEVPKQCLALADRAAGLAGTPALSHAYLSLVYYCDGLDQVLREMTESSIDEDLPQIPGDSWFPEGILYAARTSFGTVLVGGKGDNIYPVEDAFIIIDLGGNDYYFFDERLDRAREQTHADSCCTIIDLGGDDSYAGGQGMAAAGILGFGTIVDLCGNDVYRTGHIGLGAGFLGLGLLVDASGDDRYFAGRFSLGAGAFGQGVLIDGGGDDIYKGAGLCQGFAAQNGIGLLVEEAGFDIYHCISPGASIEHGIAQRTAAACFSQGCSAGILPGMAGGIGMLLDLSGDDIYKGASICQGASRGAGLGLLLDVSGYDFYNGGNRCQGFGAGGGDRCLEGP